MSTQSTGRAEAFARLAASARNASGPGPGPGPGPDSDPFDVLVIGGGATGLGIAVDAVTRGFRTALVEAGDFAQATSSRATKLVHGGVRYLASGQVQLVYEALRERAVMLRNAPHLVKPQSFILPTYSRRELPYYGAGLLLYDVMSGKATMGPTRLLGRRAALAAVPNLATDGLSGGILYHDGQFNDARLALALARTADDHGATVVNYARCSGLIEEGGRLTGARITDVESGVEYSVAAKAIFNAAGIFSDQVRRLEDAQKPALLTLSRGTHIVVAADVLGASAGLMIPKTRDGRVIFAIPWQGKVVVGTTDVAANGAAMEPGHTGGEIEYLLETINPYLARRIDRGDVLAVFSGLRPLVTGKGATTAKISREHFIDLSDAGLVTVAGGKWTTYRRMAEDAINFAAAKGLLERRPCVSAATTLHGAGSAPSDADAFLREYGSDAAEIEALITAEPALAATLDAALPYTMAEALYAVRHEMARTVEDVLSRRTRALLLDAHAALRAAPSVAEMLARELGRDEAWVRDELARFGELVRRDYLP